MFHNEKQLFGPTNLTNRSLYVNWQCTADGDLSREHSEKGRIWLPFRLSCLLLLTTHGT